MKKKKVILLLVLFFIIMLLVTRVVIADTTLENEKKLKLAALSLASSNNITKIGEDLPNLFHVEMDGEGSAVAVGYFTMWARNVKDENQIVHITVVGDIMHVRDLVSKSLLTNGTYYISDVFLNPHLPESSDYIIYSKDLSIENALPLDYYVEFEIIVNENVDNSVDIKEPENKHENVDVSNSVDIEEPENKAENIDVNNVVDVEKTENTNNIKDNNKDNNKVNSDKVKEVSNTKNTSVVPILVVTFLIICVVLLIIIIIASRKK